MAMNVTDQKREEMTYPEKFWLAASEGQVEAMERLSKNNLYSREELLSTTRQGDAPIHAAARNVHQSAIAYLLRTRADVNLRNDRGQTALHLVCSEENGAISEDARKRTVALLMQNGAFPRLPDVRGIPALSLLQEKGWEVSIRPKDAFFQAIAVGNLEEFKRLFKKIVFGKGSQGCFDRNGNSFFHCIVDSLANPSAKAAMLREAVSHGRLWAKIPNDSWGSSAPLINIPNENGLAPLYLAALKGEYELAQIFLEHGADPNQSMARAEFVPLDVAPTPEFVRLLHAYGAKILPMGIYRQRSSLHYAVQKGRKEVAEVLLELGADPHAKSHNKNTPLHDARTVDCAQLLLDWGASIDAQDDYGYTPLHAAIERESYPHTRTGSADLVFFLLRAKPDLSCENNPLWFARDYLKNAERNQRGEEIVAVLQTIISALEKAMSSSACQVLRGCSQRPSSPPQP